MLIAVVLGTWLVLSVPVALVAGRLMRLSSLDASEAAFDVSSLFSSEPGITRLADAGAFLG